MRNLKTQDLFAVNEHHVNIFVLLGRMAEEVKDRSMNPD